MYLDCRILGGDHIPSGGQTSANAVTVNQAGEPEEYDYEYYDDTRYCTVLYCTVLYCTVLYCTALYDYEY